MTQGIRISLPMFCLLVPLQGLAWEVDNVTCRYKDLQDTQVQTNAETNKRIKAALDIANDGRSRQSREISQVPRPSSTGRSGTGSKKSGGGTSGGASQAVDPAETEAMMARIREQERAEYKHTKVEGGCDTQDALDALRGAIAAAHMGNMETWAMQAKISKCEVETDKSVYRDFTFLESPIMRGGAGLNSVIQINGTKIGADKLSHFMTEGYEYYMNQRKGADLRTILQQGIDEEEGGYGLRTTGIKSYADMVANYQGYTFWRQVLEGDDPYLKCENGKWVQRREFRWEEYVNAGMDESVNCNTYKNDQMQQKVNRQTKRIVQASGGSQTHVQCPLDPAGCREVLHAIREPIAAAIVIHPQCRKAGENMMSAPMANDQSPSDTERGVN